MFETFLIKPLYNGFIYLIGIMPHGDVGFAIIAMTIVVRAVFYPAFTASIRTQMGMAAVQGELDEINRKFKDNTEEKTKRTMQLFKDNKVRPFASILAILVQLPIFIALYYAFFREGLPHIATNLLYSFVKAPSTVNLDFFGLNLLTPHHIILAVLVGGLQYAVIKLSLMRSAPKAGSPAQDPAKAQAQRMQQNLMLYMMPALYSVIAYTLPAAAGLYFATTNLISLGQEWIIKRQLDNKKS